MTSIQYRTALTPDYQCLAQSGSVYSRPFQRVAVERGDVQSGVRPFEAVRKREGALHSTSIGHPFDLST
jgi:hypothetical protein